MTFKVIKTHPDSIEAKGLIEELSSMLLKITGDDGKASFANQDLNSPRSSFIVIQCNGENVACGGIRPISSDVCEIKRMYSRKTRRGLGTIVLRELEKQAKEFGYKEIWLSTRKINRKAVAFYLVNDYLVRESYGRYKNRAESVCLSKGIVNYSQL